MKTEQQLRKEFAAYFLDLKASMTKDGGNVSKSSEWLFFLQHLIDEGELHTDAINFKCPRSLKSKQ